MCNNRPRGRAQSAFYLDECQTYLRKKAVEQHKKFENLHNLVMSELRLLSYSLCSKSVDASEFTYFCDDQDEGHMLRRAKWFIKDLTRRVELMGGEGDAKMGEAHGCYTG